MESKTVELFGLPGSGKTTIAISVLGRSNIAVIDAHSRILKEGFKRLLVRSPQLVLDVHPSLVAKALFDREIRRFVLGRMRQKLVTREAENNCVLLYQEGLISTVWRSLTQGSNISDTDLRHLLPCTDQVVFLDVEPSLARERIQGKRELGPINQLLADAPLDSMVWQRAVASRDLIVNLLRKELGPKLVSIDNSGQLDSIDLVHLLDP